MPDVGTLNDDNMCVGCTIEKRYRKYCRFQPPHLFHDGDGDMCNACVRKSSQTRGVPACRALRDMLKKYLMEGGDNQTSIEYFLRVNDGEIGRIFADAISNLLRI